MGQGPGDRPDTAIDVAPQPHGRESPGVVLHVTSDAATRDAIRNILRKGGLTVEEADCGAEALRRAAERPALIILDTQLPDIDGFEVCRRIKVDPALAPSMVLHLASKSVPGVDRVREWECSADGYLVNPVEPVELLVTVRNLLRLRQAERRAEAAALHWQATFDAISDGVCLVDRDDRVLRCNQAFASLLVKPMAEIVGQPYTELLDTGSSLAQSSPTAPGVARGIVELAVGDRWFRSRSDPVLDASGSPLGSVHILAEVTDRKRAEGAEATVRRNAERIDQLEKELRALERLGGTVPPGPSGPCSSLKVSEPGAFAELVRLYGDLLEQALEQRQYRLTYDLSAGLRTLGDRLGAAGAGPRDVVEIHNAVLQAKRGGALAPRIQAYLEEGRLLLLELMGVLASHYRRLAHGGRKHPSSREVPLG
jgi:DNA-binding response OmpR family regulator